MSLASAFFRENRSLAQQHVQKHGKEFVEATQDMEWLKRATEREKTFIAMAYSECSLAWLLDGDHGQTWSFARQGRGILLGSDQFAHTYNEFAGNEDRTRAAPQYQPYWADCHFAWSNFGINKSRTAVEFLTAMLNWPGHRPENVGNSPLNEALQYVVPYLGYI